MSSIMHTIGDMKEFESVLEYRRKKAEARDEELRRRLREGTDFYAALCTMRGLTEERVFAPAVPVLS